ncbi:hypothetical protein J6S88_05290 [bacterium]|nr:hypothetical protein [bacterium]
MQINATGPSFGHVLTVFKIQLDGKEVYHRCQRATNTPENMELTRAVMRSLVQNLKLRVDTPVAIKINELVPDLHYRNPKRTRPLYLKDSGREVNLLTGEHAFIDDIFDKRNPMPKPQKRCIYQNRIREMFAKANGGHINIVASTRPLVEAEGKEAHELIAIDDVVKTFS